MNNRIYFNISNRTVIKDTSLTVMHQRKLKGAALQQYLCARQIAKSRSFLNDLLRSTFLQEEQDFTLLTWARQHVQKVLHQPQGSALVLRENSKTVLKYDKAAGGNVHQTFFRCRSRPRVSARGRANRPAKLGCMLERKSNETPSALDGKNINVLLSHPTPLVS